MAMKVGGDEGGYQNDPNVVPMIDILLVLLIIFMMQVPLQRKAMDVQVPPVETVKQEQQTQSDQIVLELKEDDSYAINSKPVARAQLDAELHKIFDNRPAKLMFIKAARNRKYQEVIDAMDVARGAGVQVIGLTPKPKEG
ncbi:MAG: ExbD/TolR family protein [Gemmatimonadales bacterium]